MPRLEARAPKEATLREYGLDRAAWLAMAKRQRWTCPICEQPFGDRALAIDHEHVAGWKARKRRKGKTVRGGKRVDVRVRVMTPEQRRPYVRGILHSWCNRFVRSWLTLSRARSIVAYLEDFEVRRSR